MFREGIHISSIKMVVLGAALLASPCGVLAQHGAGAPGGGGAGGSTAGTGLSGPAGRATGVSVKDDLKDFRELMAVQATSQQIVQYSSMVKAAEAAGEELQGFLQRLAKPATGPELASLGAVLDQKIESARAENKKFLDGFSERQKSGLKEITKKLLKADSDLEQEAKALGQVVGVAKEVGPPVVNSAQSLEHALTSFRSEQADLGAEMSIGTQDRGAAVTFNLPPVKSSVNFGDETVAITTSGVISKGASEGGQNTFQVELTADLSDLQQNIIEVLRRQLNKADRCGEQIAIQSATLTPEPPASLVFLRLHFERWACFGRDTTNELAEGNATIDMKLTPAVGEDGTLRLVPEMKHINADGLVGEMLRTGSLGENVRDKVTESILSAVRQGEDFKAMLPPAAQGYTALRQAQFEGLGSGRLTAVMKGDIRVPDEKVTALTTELKRRSPSQETVLQTVPR
jgi:hypothetical protein